MDPLPTKQAGLTGLSAVLEEAGSLVGQLLRAPRSAVSDIPASQGAYLIYDKEGNIIYVGKGKNLNRRICADHRGGDKNVDEHIPQGPIQGSWYSCRKAGERLGQEQLFLCVRHDPRS